MADAGVNQYTFHVEPVEDIETVCRKVREAGMRVSGLRSIMITVHVEVLIKVIFDRLVLH